MDRQFPFYQTLKDDDVISEKKNNVFLDIAQENCAHKPFMTFVQAKCYLLEICAKLFTMQQCIRIFGHK